MDEEKRFPDDLRDGDEPDVPGVNDAKSSTANDYLRSMMNTNFIEYASYVIKERAIPDVDDGLKPVQRRILWSLFRMDDGKRHKVANVIGHTMQFHPHGDASIGDALVVLTNKHYFIEGQGNFGNLITGDGAAAPRYIECRLTQLAHDVLFNNDITPFIASYDGRNPEPVVLPCKIPALLILGSDGIAVGMATKIMPHNFNEVLQAEIACIKGEPFALYPDFQQGGLMDCRDYGDGNGKITLRAKIEIDGRRLVIREIPATTTTDSLIKSIEKATEKGKIKIASIHDYTAEKVEIEIIPTRGYDPQKALKALYTYTDCSVSITPNLMAICDNTPVVMSVTDVIKRHSEKLIHYLKLELEIELGRLNEAYHAKTLAQIYIENRLYKRIEECETQEEVIHETYAGLEPFRHLLKRDINDDDIEKLLDIKIRKISLFDIRKNQSDLQTILKDIAAVEKKLKNLKKVAVDYLEGILAKYGAMYPRRTQIETFEKIDQRQAALNNIKVGWDRKNGYIGTAVHGNPDDTVTCNEFDLLLCVERDGKYKIIDIPEKLFVDKLYAFRRNDPRIELGIVYSEKKSHKFYGKRVVIDQFIKEKEYRICPEGCRLELLTPRVDAIYEFIEPRRLLDKVTEVNLNKLPLRSPKVRGILLGSDVSKITFKRYLDADELIEKSDTSSEVTENDLMENTGAGTSETEKTLLVDHVAADSTPAASDVREDTEDDAVDNLGIPEQSEFGFDSI